MVKAIYFIKRKPAMGPEDFRRYWLTTHANLVRKVPELRRYAQSHTLDSGYRRHEPVYDGIAELWYDDTATMRRIADTPASRAAGADDANFIDMSSFDFILTEERVEVDGAVREGMPKLVSFLKRKAGMDVDAFQSYWANRHGPLASRIPGLRRYVQCHVRASAYRAGRAPRYDCVPETWFDDIDAMRASEATPEYRAVRADEANFLESGRLPFIITREYVIV
jgi:uncharacterized protein (TIGR02118 family)